MALTACPECKQQVSDTVSTCIACGYCIKKPKRGPIGRIFKWLFILFNVLMIVWLLGYWTTLTEMSSEIANNQERVDAAIGGALVTGTLIGIWIFGDIILGLIVMLTRPKA